MYSCGKNDTRVYKNESSLVSLEGLWVISHFKVLLYWFYNQLEVIKVLSVIPPEWTTSNLKNAIYTPDLQPDCVSLKISKYFVS